MYIKNKRIATQGAANTAADSRKFRAPTNDVSQYDPHLAGKRCSQTIGNSYCSPVVKHNLFAACKLSFNPSPTTG
jgi:hypothetical protein